VAISPMAAKERLLRSARNDYAVAVIARSPKESVAISPMAAKERLLRSARNDGFVNHPCAPP
ncbi:MAG: hypothetical protein OEY64_12220, partial [Nitrospinota bacterium]|nr:hypothetical protein [Nitrospinota bacterium]